ncbi:hypothetical protein P4P33_001244 [Campylobacter jejuni]|nr:hypothetical protein [Campylobacter jejuni]
MKFAECNLLVNEQTVNNFNIFYNICEDQFSYENTEYVINCEIINQNIFWIYARFGKINPYSNEIFDIETKKSGKNPKQKKQVELNKQLFCIYDLRSLVLYMSDFRKQNFLSFYLKEKFGQNFLIKKYFIKPEEFVETITSIEKISFTFKKNIFTSDIFNMVEDELGYEATECFSLETKISKKKYF